MSGLVWALLVSIVNSVAVGYLLWQDGSRGWAQVLWAVAAATAAVVVAVAVRR